MVFFAHAFSDPAGEGGLNSTFGFGAPAGALLATSV